MTAVPREAAVRAIPNHIGFTLDAHGNPLTGTYPLGQTTPRTFDLLGWETTATVPLGGHQHPGRREWTSVRGDLVA